MTTLQDTYKALAKTALQRHDSFGYGFWCKRLKEANTLEALGCPTGQF